MATPRYGYTATLLSDGTVLVAGGDNDSFGPLATAELYDPDSGTWSATGRLIQARAYHAATLLSDGRVLVTGGFPSVSSAEVYDPVTGTWSTAGSMTIAHSFHTAILLNEDGPVLVIGGFTDRDSDAISIAELYDPVTATWSVTGQRLITSRGDHMATLLADGRVLVAGGAGDTNFDNTLSSAEIYDPTADTFSRTASMIRPRYSHTGTRLNNGQVLVTGGFSRNGGFQSSCELYTP